MTAQIGEGFGHDQRRLYARQEAQQKASHDSYKAPQSIYDQALLWNIRSFELDVHCDTAAVPGQSNWRITHNSVVEKTTSVYDLHTLSQILDSIHRAAPKHEVFTIFLEMTDPAPFDYPLSPEQFDDELVYALDPAAILTTVYSFGPGIWPTRRVATLPTRPE